MANQAHITAGDLSPVTIRQENTYGTPTGSPILYGDVRPEGGAFSPKDTPNPHLAWRYGSRSYDPADYVTRQEDAGFSAGLEVRDVSGWERILAYALGTGGTGTGPLPSRTESIHVRVGASWQGRKYTGCKTDSLAVKCDTPGGIVQFDEDVIASKGEADNINTALAAWSSSDAPAVQWMNGITLGGAPIYPQSFSLTVANNLDRNREFKDGKAVTGAVLEGRRDIRFECELWMEDLAYVNSAITNGSPGQIVLTLGIANPVTLTLSGVSWIADGTNADLVQDKQRQTLRFRVAGVAVTTPGA